MKWRTGAAVAGRVYHPKARSAELAPSLLTVAQSSSRKNETLKQGRRERRKEVGLSVPSLLPMTVDREILLFGKAALFVIGGRKSMSAFMGWRQERLVSGGFPSSILPEGAVHRDGDCHMMEA